MWIFWLVLAAILVVVEIFTVSFYALWLAFAAAAAAGIAALWPNMIWLQLLIAAVVALVMVPFTPTLTKKLQTRSPGFKDTKLDVIGKTAVVVQEVGPNQLGLVKIAGHGDWTASTNGSAALPEGATVVIEAVNGTIVSVAPFTPSEQ